MPSQTLSQYITRIREYLGEPDSTTSRWTDTFLTNLFNASYRLRATDLIAAYEGYFLKVVETPLVASQSYYVWPNDFERLQKLEIVRSDGRTVPLQRWERHEAVNTPPIAADDSYKPTFRPQGQGFRLEPSPNSTQASGSLRIEYNRTMPRLANDSDLLDTDFPLNFEELLVLDTVVFAMDAEGMMETGQIRSIRAVWAEWVSRWERYIDNRMVFRDRVTPWIASYINE